MKLITFLSLIILAHTCSSHCTKCTSSRGPCLTCADKFYLTPPTCYICPDRCSTCRNQSYCTSCEIGSYMLNFSCISCDPGCVNCNNSHCQQCKNGLYLKDGQCSNCSQGCMSCLNQASCITCLHTHYAQNNTCKPCSTGCLTCSSGGTCLQCLKEYQIVEQANTSFCVQCPPLCVSCSNDKICLECQQAAYLSEDSTCMSCGSKCIECASKQFCLNCSDNHYLDQGICKQNPSTCNNCQIINSCINCDSTLICDLIFFKTYLNSNECQQQKQSASNVFFLMIVIIIPVGICFCIILGIIKKSKGKAAKIGQSSIASQSTVHGETSMREIVDSSGLKWTPKSNKGLDFVSQCPICQQKGVNASTVCNHMFHLSCIAMWVYKNANCPMCRSQNMHVLNVYCSVCHCFYVQRQVKHRETSALNKETLCDFCKTI